MPQSDEDKVIGKEAAESEEELISFSGSTKCMNGELHFTDL